MNPSTLTLALPRIAGDRRGRTIGFPTVNMECPADITPDMFGVYPSTLEVDSIRYPSITHIGPRPSVDRPIPVIETHILHQDIHIAVGTVCTLTLVLDRIRSIQSFPSLEALKSQLTQDCSIAEEYLHNHTDFTHTMQD